MLRFGSPKASTASSAKNLERARRVRVAPFHFGFARSGLASATDAPRNAPDPETPEECPARLDLRNARDRARRASRTAEEREAANARNRANRASRTAEERANANAALAAARAAQRSTPSHSNTYRTARKFPTNGTISQHDVGFMEHECPHCQAFHFTEERTRSSDITGSASYSMCCMHGQMQLSTIASLRHNWTHC